MSESPKEQAERMAAQLLSTRRGQRAAHRRAFKGILDMAGTDALTHAKYPPKRYRPANARRLAREARRAKGAKR